MMNIDERDRSGRHPLDFLAPSLHFAADLRAEALAWLWPLRIPRACLTLLFGDPGVGKSLFMADLAARVTAACPWPDGATAPEPQLASRPDLATRRHPASVVFAAPEDAPAEVLVPRLAAAGANANLVAILTGIKPFVPRSSLTRFGNESRDPSASTDFGNPYAADSAPLLLPTHLPLLAQAVRAVTVPRLLVLDPLHALLAPEAQHSAAALVQVIAGLNEIAQRHDLAIVAVSHLVKSRAARTLYRVRGSLALVAAARSILLLSADPADPDRRILSSVKTVYCAPPPPCAFRIDATGRLAWEAATTAGNGASGAAAAAWRHTPDELLDLSADTHSALSEACEYLAARLGVGPQPARELMAEARAHGFTPKTLRRAKRLLAIGSHYDGTRWLWGTARA